MSFAERIAEDLMSQVRNAKDAEKLERKYCTRCGKDCSHCPLDEMVKFHLDHVAPILGKKFN